MFQKGIRNVVEDWMQMYCKALGIDIPKSESSNPMTLSSSHVRSVSSQTRMVKSSLGYATGLSGSV